MKESMEKKIGYEECRKMQTEFTKKFADRCGGYFRYFMFPPLGKSLAALYLNKSRIASVGTARLVQMLIRRSLFFMFEKKYFGVFF